MYSTMPAAFFGASLMSVMIALRGSFGSSSPNARPATVSYWPAGPNAAPSKAGDTFFSMTIFLTRAAAGEASASEAATRMAVNETARRMFIVVRILAYFEGHFGHGYAKAEQANSASLEDLA